MLLDKVKQSLRYEDNSFDEDLQDSIDAAIADLELSGILGSKIVETDPLIIRAIKTFCKAEYSIDNNEAQRYRESYNMLKIHLALSREYTTEEVL
ncbi:uncharacterized phage protein (possible DNA packaging) [Clostridium sp. USBA 49]|uniref:head-tail connector protein n=1 Tax=Clostridium sp. USBA 49 TaxID=1881060 RepID=UPI0009990376|nr:head-tail connector protein [Clostridium sp. USBA 49]SKA89687.1 uncharacterized phage protein (possible DNA packaging) [Clostridium sp. USBA 49]